MSREEAVQNTPFVALAKKPHKVWEQPNQKRDSVSIFTQPDAKKKRPLEDINCVDIFTPDLDLNAVKKKQEIAATKIYTTPAEPSKPTETPTAKKEQQDFSEEVLFTQYSKPPAVILDEYAKKMASRQ